MSIQIKNPKSEIRNPKSARGFSLTEVLIAIGILAVGMLFIAGAFPVSIHFTTVATERTIAPIVADEAFAKIKLYGISYISTAPYAEFAYPSTPTADPNSKQYWWSAIFQNIDTNDVRVTVFVSRKVGATATYPNPPNPDSPRPVAVNVGVSGTAGNYDISITGNKTWINDGCTIVDDFPGQIYRVLERYPSNDTFIKLDRPWQGGSSVWVVPPPVNGGRYPCIGVYQKVMSF